MRALLAELGDPQLAYPSIHVVGTNGKSTTTRLTAALLRAEELRVGAYTSPHVVGLGRAARYRRCGVRARGRRVRAAAERAGATQFEALTAAALAEFAEQGVDAAVVEAGLGGRLDATNVLRAPVVVLTNVGLEHTAQLGETREEIAVEKLAVVQPGATVVLCEPEWEPLARSSGAGAVVVTGRSNLALAVAAAESFLGAAGRPRGGRRGARAGPARAARRRSARDLGRRAQPRRGRLAAAAPAGPAVCRCRLDPARQERGRDAGRALRRRRRVRRDDVGEHPRPARRGTCNACADDGSRERRRSGTQAPQSRAHDRSRARREPSSSRGRCTCSPTSAPGAEGVRFGARGG